MAQFNILQALLGGGQSTDISELVVPAARAEKSRNDDMLMPIVDRSNDEQFAKPLQFTPDPDPQGVEQVRQPGVPQSRQPSGINYNNTQQATDVNSALMDEPQLRGGSANPGVYGLLPQRLQHGNLRNILGAIGDAFLVSGGQEPRYSQRMERQQMGQSIAGLDPNDQASVQAAIQRLASTGAPGSIDEADRLQKNFNDYQTHKDQQAQLQAYREAQMDYKRDSLINRLYNTITGDLGRATSAADYQRRLERWDKRIKEIDPTMDAATVLGVPPEYDPAVVDDHMGMTSNQRTQSSDRARQREQSETNARINAGARITSSNINAGPDYASVAKPTPTTVLVGIMERIKRGQSISREERALVERQTQPTGRGGRTALPASVNLNPPVAAPARRPTVGTIRNGYKYRGGDPSKPASWVKVR